MNFNDTEWYRTGRVNIKNGAAIVRGVSTEWLLAGIKSGDMFTVDGSQFYEIESITSSTELNLKTQFKGENCEGQSYAIIIRTHAVMQAEIAAQLAALLDRWNSSDLATVIEFANKWQDSEILSLAGILSDWQASDVEHLTQIVQEWNDNGVTQLTALLDGWSDGDAERLLNLLNDWDDKKTLFNNLLYKTVSLTAGVTDWKTSDESVNSYEYYADIANETITADMTPIVTVMPSSIDTANNAEMCSFAFAFDGKLRLFAHKAPAGDINLSVLLLGGADLTNTSDDNTGGNSGTGDNDTGDNTDTGDNDNTGSDNNNDSTGTGSESGDDSGLVTQDEIDDIVNHMWD